MKNDNFETNLVGRELSEDELMMIQGGNWLSDIGNAIVDGAKAVGHAISDGVNAVGHAVQQGVVAVGRGVVRYLVNEVKNKLLHPRW